MALPDWFRTITIAMLMDVLFAISITSVQILLCISAEVVLVALSQPPEILHSQPQDVKLHSPVESSLILHLNSFLLSKEFQVC